MKKANVAELKNRLSHYLNKVKRGETVLVMERSIPVARIVPLICRENGTESILRLCNIGQKTVRGSRQ